MDQELTDYIVQAQKHGLSDFEIKQNLLTAGWEAGKIEENFAFARAAENKELFAETQTTKTRNSISAQTSKFHDNPNSPTGALSPFAVKPAAVLSDSNFIKPINATKTHFFSKPIFWVALVLLFILSGGAYGYYQYIYATPQTVWNKFLNSNSGLNYKSDYTLNYSYGAIQPTSSSTKISYALNGKTYNNFTDPKNIEFSNNITASVNSATNEKLSADINYLFTSNVLYLNISSILSALGGQEKVPSGWIKLDFNEIKKYLQDSQNPSLKDFSVSLDKITKSPDDIRSILSSNKIAKPTDYFNKEQINGVGVYHLKIAIDVNALGSAFSDAYNKLHTASGTAAQITPDQMTLISSLLKKFTVKEFEVWIGQKDNQIYKTRITVSAPAPDEFSGSSLADLISPLSVARAKSRDAKRLSDIRQMSSALELYYNDAGGYPPAVNGAPDFSGDSGLNGIVFPTPPLPADGNCSFYNNYWYIPSGKTSNYKGAKVSSDYGLTFCLGAAIGGYKAGIARLSPQGIVDNIPCPSTTAERCSSNASSQQSNVQNEINGLNFAAEITFDSIYSDYGKKETLTPPEQSTNVMDFVTQAQGTSADAKRLSDVTQIAAALELYFKSKNTYPDKLSELTPDYMGKIPEAPPIAPGSTVCSEQDNTYLYSKESTRHYIFLFCLGNTTGGYSPGKHYLSEAGIH